MGMIKNQKGVVKDLYAWVDAADGVAIAHYRGGLNALFTELLETTPQSSGRAVANWKISIGGPDLSWDPDVGDSPEVNSTKDGGMHVTWGHRQKGDRKWIDYARFDQGSKLTRGSPKGGRNTSKNSNRVQLGDRVFFSNRVQGDDNFGGAGSTYYLDDLQHDWAGKLRAVNQPYQTVAETLLRFSWETFKMGGSTYLDEFI